MMTEEEPLAKRCKTDVQRELLHPWHGALFRSDTMPFEVAGDDDALRIFLRHPSLIQSCSSRLIMKHEESDFATMRIVFEEDSEWRTNFLSYEDVPPDHSETYRGLGIEHPVCHHNVDAKRAVTKSNAKGNMGREYFSCGAAVRYDRRCDFFMWTEDIQNIEPFKFIEADATRASVDLVRASVDGIDDEKRLEMWSCLEQGSDEWLAIRRNPWATASSVGYLLDDKKVHGLTLKKVWVADGGKGSSATRHGHHKEPDAVRLAESILAPTDDGVVFSVVTGYGTWVSKDGTVAVSPDGVIFAYRKRGTEVDPPHIVIGLECKAPYSVRECARDAAVYPVSRVSDNLRAPCSPVYYAQMQTLMRELGLKAMMFVAVTSRVADVSFFPYDETHATKVAHAAARWSNDVIELLSKRNSGELAVGHIF